MDRSANELPVSALHRYNYAQPATRRYNDAAKKGAAPTKKLEDLSGDGEVTKKDLLIKKGIIDAPLKRKFCGGTSKPYGKKK